MKQETLERLWNLSSEMLKLMEDDRAYLNPISVKVHEIRQEIEKDLKDKLFQKFVQEAA